MNDILNAVEELTAEVGYMITTLEIQQYEAEVKGDNDGQQHAEEQLFWLNNMLLTIKNDLMYNFNAVRDYRNNRGLDS